MTDLGQKLRNTARPPMRPDEATGEDPRARAARRAAEIRESLNGSLDDGTDKFYIPPEEIPDGWTYEWKRKTVMGQEDHTYQTALLRKGWEPVPASRHPDRMPIGHAGSIEIDGLILMERPTELTDEARKIELRTARQQVRTKEEQLNNPPSPGQFERANKDNSLVKIRKSHEPMPIPKE